ncbi:hypothetical protein GCM10010411_88010 [Actinomadura fulvescens]|uniref:Uncharacterized protein n=1 Tax=Actinomadura fulvescens TaxID=46160 RepID=A0ABP6DAD0_9ACTN
MCGARSDEPTHPPLRLPRERHTIPGVTITLVQAPVEVREMGGKLLGVAKLGPGIREGSGATIASEVGGLTVPARKTYRVIGADRPGHGDRGRHRPHRVAAGVLNETRAPFPRCEGGGSLSQRRPSASMDSDESGEA